MPAIFNLLRDSAHLLLAASLLLLLASLPQSLQVSYKLDGGLGLLLVRPLVSADAAADWAVLAQVTLLGLVLFRLGDLLVGTGQGALDFRGRVGELGIKEAEKFGGACAAGIWMTRHLLLLLLFKMHPYDEFASTDRVVLHTTSVVAVVFVALTVAHIVHNDEDDYEEPVSEVPADEKAQESNVTAVEDEEKVTFRTRHVGFQRAMLAAALVVGKIVVWHTARHGWGPLSWYFLPVLLSLPLFHFAHRLSCPHLTLATTTALLVWFYVTSAYSHGVLGSSPAPPPRLLVHRAVLYLSSVVICALSVQLLDIYLTFRTRAVTVPTRDAWRLIDGVRRAAQLGMDRAVETLLRFSVRTERFGDELS